MRDNMNIDPRLHHYCQNVITGSLETVLEMYELLNCKVVYRPKSEYKWAMVGQEQLQFSIQIAEVPDAPITDIDKKRQTHVAFISDDPQALINKVESWAKQENIAFRQGGWSKIERYFDLPDLFVNFVVEVMHTSIEEE